MDMSAIYAIYSSSVDPLISLALFVEYAVRRRLRLGSASAFCVTQISAFVPLKRSPRRTVSLESHCVIHHTPYCYHLLSTAYFSPYILVGIAHQVLTK
ncbi:hypothetical protein F4823DRAFT_611927 [Ustulina deusta]|nr:hypothetical protein F4823DRAFT_611927 [Ustulina deusta]